MRTTQRNSTKDQVIYSVMFMVNKFMSQDLTEQIFFLQSSTNMRQSDCFTSHKSHVLAIRVPVRSSLTKYNAILNVQIME